MITIIVPIYNAERTLRQCIDSILKLEYKDYELLLINDGSVDTSRQICDEYALANKRIRVINKVNEGVSSARNTGLDNANGEWVTFIDADDYVETNFLSGVLNNEHDLIVTNYKDLNPDKTFLYPLNLLNKNSFTTQEEIVIFITRYISTPVLRGPCCKFYRRSLLTDIRFSPILQVGEDTHFVLRYLARVKSICFLPLNLYVIRVGTVVSEVKYSQTVEKSIISVDLLYNTYQELLLKYHLPSYLFIDFLNYFERISLWKNFKASFSWYKDKRVKNIYDFVWEYISTRRKIKYILLQLISYFVR